MGNSIISQTNSIPYEIIPAQHRGTDPYGNAPDKYVKYQPRDIPTHAFDFRTIKIKQAKLFDGDNIQNSYSTISWTSNQATLKSKYDTRYEYDYSLIGKEASIPLSPELELVFFGVNSDFERVASEFVSMRNGSANNIGALFPNNHLFLDSFKDFLRQKGSATEEQIAALNLGE